MSTNKNSAEIVKALFFKKFTENLIKSTKTYYILELEEIMKRKKIEPLEKYQAGVKNKVNYILQERNEYENEILSEGVGEFQNISSSRKIRNMPKPVPMLLTIPMPTMPEKFSHLRPTPTDIQIDLGKLNSLILDRAVNMIECRGSDEKIRVKTNEIRETNIILNSEEINQIIRKFEEKSKIPSFEGIYNVVVGRLILSADISKSVGTKFTITKISPPNPRGVYR